MFTSTWWVIALVLLFVLLTFLTTIGFSNFCSLNLCLATIFQSINISVALLSKSAFTVIPSYISIFSTPISSYASLSILNILLTSLCLPLSFAIPFGASVCVLPCYTFLFIGHAAFLQFYYSLFLSTLYSRYRIFFLFYSDTITNGHLLICDCLI